MSKTIEELRKEAGDKADRKRKDAMADLMFGDIQQSVRLSMFEKEHICQYCGCLTVQSDDLCYANPKNNPVIGIDLAIEKGVQNDNT